MPVALWRCSVVVQGGGYGEHRIDSFTLEGSAEATAVNGAAFALTLEAGTAATLEVAMTRYANAPTMSPPWDAEPAAKAAKL